MTTIEEHRLKYFFVSGVYNYTYALKYYAKNIQYTSCIITMDDNKYPTMDDLYKILYNKIKSDGYNLDSVYELTLMCCNEWSLEQYNAFHSVKPEKEKISSID